MAAVMDEIVSLGLKGVKIHPDIQRFAADDSRVLPIYALCEEKGLSICVHTGDHRYDFSNPPRIAGILRAFPKLKFIGAHFGGWSVWDEAARLLADFPNIVVDSSSSLLWMAPERARELVRFWGAERVMFGTDYPLWPQQPELDRIRRMELTDREYDLLLRQNAANLFQISI